MTEVFSELYPPDVLRAVMAEGAARYPAEACGLIFEGPNGVRVLPLPNVLDRYHARDPQRFPRTSRTGYLMDPLAQLRAQEEAERAGEHLRAIFHSHPDVGAYFSEEDRALALNERGDPVLPGVEYLVLSVRPDGCDDLRGFRFEPGGISSERDVPLPGKGPKPPKPKVPSS